MKSGFLRRIIVGFVVVVGEFEMLAFKQGVVVWWAGL